MAKRKMLKTRYKPKHHYFSHYPDLFLKFGPLIYMWTLAFEHRHQFFKRVATIFKNFINLGYTLSSKFQLLQAYMNMGPLFCTSPLFSKSSPLIVGGHGDEMQALLETCNFSGDALKVESVVLNDMKYRTKQWLLLGEAPDNYDIFVGKIELLVCDGHSCTAVVMRFRATKWKEFGLFKFDDSSPGELIAVPLHGIHENPSPHAIYKFKAQTCFSKKHAFLS
jgi:hypothetical protein